MAAYANISINTLI